MKKLIEVDEARIEAWMKVLSQAKQVIESQYPNDADILTIPLVAIKEYIGDLAEAPEYEEPVEEVKEEVKKNKVVGAPSLLDALDALPDAKTSPDGGNPKHYKHVRLAIKEGRIKGEK